MTPEEEEAANMAELSRLRGEMWEADRQAALEVLREMTVESELVPVLPDAPEVDALFDQVFGPGWRDDLILVGVLRSGVLELVAREREACAQAAEAHAARVRIATADVGWKMSEELEERAVECEKVAAAIRARAAP